MNQNNRLIIRWKDGYANIEVNRIEKVEDVVFAYGGVDGNVFVGMFDLGAVDMLYLVPAADRKVPYSE